jgi:hypothetical protein
MPSPKSWPGCSTQTRQNALQKPKPTVPQGSGTHHVVKDDLNLLVGARALEPHRGVLRAQSRYVLTDVTTQVLETPYGGTLARA